MLRKVSPCWTIDIVICLVVKVSISFLLYCAFGCVKGDMPGGAGATARTQPPSATGRLLISPFCLHHRIRVLSASSVVATGDPLTPAVTPCHGKNVMPNVVARCHFSCHFWPLLPFGDFSFAKLGQGGVCKGTSPTLPRKIFRKIGRKLRFFQAQG